MLRNFEITFFAIVVALSCGTAHAVIVVNETFEVPDVDSGQSDGFTSGGVPAGWVGATQGFGASRRGVVDESHGDFVDPVGEQAFAFRYTNSGLTSGIGLIGALTAGETYNISFDVVMDGHNNGRPWRVKLVTFDEFAARNDVRNNNGTSVLYEDNGSAPDTGAYQTISFNYTADEVLDAADLDKDLALRFIGATTSATIDNVIVDVTPPGPEFFLKLMVDTTTGQTDLVGRGTNDIDINYYQITSEGDSLDASGWNSFDDQGISGDAWLEAGGSGSHSLAEGLAGTNTTVLANSTMPLGMGYDESVDARDLVFTYRTAGGQIVEGIVEYSGNVPGDYDGDGDVDSADYTTWRSQFGSAGTPGEFSADGNADGNVDAADYTVWQDNFGVGTASALGTDGEAVPEPQAALLLLIGGAAMLYRRTLSC